MTPFPHRYHVHLAGGATGYAQLSTSGIPALTTALPAQFDGPGDAWSPEHLLLAAVQACFLFTLRAVARASKMEFLAIELDVTGTVDRAAGVTRFSEIVLRPALDIAADTDQELLRRILEKTAKACLVSASLSTPVRLEPPVINYSTTVRDISPDRLAS
jgi:peroxiredoxin-like protein